MLLESVPLETHAHTGRTRPFRDEY